MLGLDISEIYGKLSKEQSKKFGHIFNELGFAFYFKSDYLKANELITIAYMLDSENTQIIFNLASAKARLGDYNEALRLFDLAESKDHNEKDLIKKWREWIKKRL